MSIDLRYRKLNWIASHLTHAKMRLVVLIMFAAWLFYDLTKSL